MESNPKFNRVMVIDDSQIDRIIAQKVLIKFKLAEEVVSLESGKAALEYLQQITDTATLPQIIFLDISMPAMDGFEFMEKYSELPEWLTSYCRVIMLSSSINPEDKVRALSNPHIYRFFSKPLDPDEINQIID